MLDSESRKRLVDLFLRFNRRLNFIVVDTPHELTINESHVLMEIGFDPGITAKQISLLLNLEKSNISRTLKHLEKLKLIKRDTAHHDAREKHLQLTARGAVVAKVDSVARNLMASECVKTLSQSEVQELAPLLHRMGDNLDALKVHTKPEDDPIKIAIRRLTRSMGFLGNNVLNANMPIEELQVIYLLYKFDNTLSMTKLKSLLPYENSALSRLISKLGAAGILKKEFAPQDKRFVNVRLLKKGEQTISKALFFVEEMLTRGVHNFSQKDFSRLLELLEFFLLVPQIKHSNIRGQKFDIKSIEHESDRQRARSFLVEGMVRENIHDQIPPSLLAPSHICYELVKSKKLIGICDIKPEDSNWNVEAFWLDADAEANYIFFNRILEIAFKDKIISSVSMSPQLEVSQRFQELADRKLSSEENLIFTKENFTRLERLIA